LYCNNAKIRKSGYEKILEISPNSNHFIKGKLKTIPFVARLTRRGLAWPGKGARVFSPSLTLPPSFCIFSFSLANILRLLEKSYAEIKVLLIIQPILYSVFLSKNKDILLEIVFVLKKK
jgi:hypothetical protein